MNAKAISETSKASGCGPIGLALFGFVFLAAGSAFFYFMVVSPALKSRAAADWPGVECKIQEAKIESHHSDDGTTYEASFVYQYQVDGKSYRGTQFSFAQFSGPRSIAQKIVDQYPVGSTHLCYPEPGNPENAVLDRNNSNMPFWFSLFPLLFVLVGGGIMVGSVWSWFKKRGNSISGNVTADSLNDQRQGFTSTSTPSASMKPVPGEMTDADRLDREWSEPRKLQASHSRVAVFLFLLLFAVIWNGFIAFFVYQAFDFGGGWEWGKIVMSLFMIPFVLVGIGVLLGSMYFFLAMFNPKVEIALSSAAVPLGGEVDLAWEIEGKVERIKKLTIEVHGVQSATYTRGTDTVTETEIFERIPVATASDIQQIAFGSVAVQIPENSMHTFEANRNKILWSIQVHGEIPMAPDINESFPFRVTPGTLLP